MTERCSDCRGDGSNDHPFQVACKQQHPAPFQDEHGFYEKRRLPQRERCPDCHGQWYSRNGPTGAQETCKHPWHDANTPKASEQRTMGEEWENAKAVMSGEMPPCECTLRDKAPSAYHNAKCPRHVADKL